MTSYGENGANGLGPEKQAEPPVNHVEEEMHSYSEQLQEEGNIVFTPVQRQKRKYTYFVHIFAWISMLISAMLFILWVIISFTLGVMLRGVDDSGIRSLSTMVLVFSVFAVVVYLLMTLTVAVFIWRSLGFGCSASTLYSPSLFPAVVCVLLLILSSAMVCLAGFLTTMSWSGEEKAAVIVGSVFTAFSTLFFAGFFVLWAVYGARRA